MEERLRTIRDQMLADLLPGIIHEINNPLGAIIMNLSITRDDVSAWKEQGTQPDADMMLEALADMESASERINGHLKALSYFCGSRFLEDPAELDVPTFIQHAMNLAHNRFKRVIPITFDDGDEPGGLSVQAPPALFLLLLLLALETAATAAGDRPLRLSAVRQGDRIHVAFSRAGMKIDRPDERLVALCAQTGVELLERESGLVLAVAPAFTAARPS